jgi:ribosome-associated toxin RatA of RatAB toxin-antitoxin module
VVERSGQDIVFTYSHMSTSGQTSRHYLEVRLFPFGSQWQLTPKRSTWFGREDSVFQALDGSWYMEALTGDRIYVRYFLSADFDTGVPGFLVDLVARRQLPDGVRRVIEVLSAQARR